MLGPRACNEGFLQCSAWPGLGNLIFLDFNVGAMKMRVTRLPTLSILIFIKKEGRGWCLWGLGVHPFKAMPSLQRETLWKVRKCLPDTVVEGRGEEDKEEGEKERGGKWRTERREKREAERAEREGHVSKQRLHSERPLALARLAGLWFLPH